MDRAPLLASLALSVALSAPAAAIEILGTRPTPVTLEVSEGQLIRLDGPATSVFIADPEIADVEVMSPRLIYVFGRLAGQTNLFAVGADDQVVASLTLTVTPDMGRMGQAARLAAPASSVELGVVDDQVVISGQFDSPAAAADVARIVAGFVPPENIINNGVLATSNQVNLRVRVAEVSRQAVRNLGIDLEAMLSGDFVFSLTTGRIPSLGSTTIGLGFNGDDFEANALIDALEAEDLVHILAEPNLTAVSGETATFLAGGEFPVPIPGDDGQISVEYKAFGVSLSFTPTILRNGRISMRVRPEVSQLSTEGSVQIGGLTIPALTTRRAETTVELGSGQSFAIAGLFQRRATQQDDNIPGLGNLPILGELFRSTQFQRNETELVIVVTPYLVQPVSERALLLPTDQTGPGTPPLGAQAAQGAGFGFILK